MYRYHLAFSITFPMYMCWFLNVGKVRMSYIEAFQANKVNSSIPVLTVRRTVTVGSLLHCANLCLQAPGCITFAFRHLKVQMKRGITDAGDYASASLGSQGEMWGREDVLWFAVGIGLCNVCMLRL